ncbi:MAG: hypothetical protein Q8L59_10565 [Phenylobacterium sp.]|uniref:hypothetical protein n=1 Tax=Phenylobacterium sp. TaxID=1871053 RepID=UPI002733CF78|nr:hypothetical protein [Phenylobacterium sp.]MDP1642615.1 hypothetical protein [Phenylobacterium sp.]MDP3118746.1 hypothetical protein [Phenylobacterium sp.]
MINFPPIDLASFSWEALATLVTGLAAVTAAAWVGRRQTAILASQAAVQRYDLIAKLFELRSAAYYDVRSHLSWVVAHSARPDAEQNAAFARAVERCRFLFPEALYEHVRDIDRRLDVYQRAHASVERRERRGEEFGDTLEKEGDLFAEIATLLRELPDVFAPHIRIGLEP